MLEHHRKYNDIADWSLADLKNRMLPHTLVRVYRSGRSAADKIRSWNGRRELETCHAAQELLLLAMVLGRLVRSEDDIVKYLDKAEEQDKENRKNDD